MIHRSFGALVIDGANGQPARLGDLLDPWQAADFTALDPAWRRIAGQQIDNAPTRAWLERPRGHSKTADLAVMITWALAFSRRQINGVAAAADRDQARLLRDAISRLVQGNPWLGQVLDIQTYRIINLRTGSVLTIISSDAATSYGLTPDFIVVDELTHWKSRELWDSLLSSSAKRNGCLLVVITNAGFREGWQWTTREAIRQNDRWLFRRLEGPVASWITSDRLAEQQHLLPPIAYQRLWLNEWTSGSGDAIDPGDLKAAFTLQGPLTAPESGYGYVGGLDLGLSRDASALVVVGKQIGWLERRLNGKPIPPASTLAAMVDVGTMTAAPQDYETIRHPGDGHLQLVSVDVWQPARGVNVDLDAVEARILDLHYRLGLACIGYDPWQCELLAQRLRKCGVPMLPVPFTPANLTSMATEVVGNFRDRRLQLYVDARLRDDLSRLRITEKGYGIRLDSPRGPSGHGDCATALALALHAAKGIVASGPMRIDRPLLIGVGSRLF